MYKVSQLKIIFFNAVISIQNFKLAMEMVSTRLLVGSKSFPPSPIPAGKGPLICARQTFAFLSLCPF